MQQLLDSGITCGIMIKYDAGGKVTAEGSVRLFCWEFLCTVLVLDVQQLVSPPVLVLLALFALFVLMFLTLFMLVLFMLLALLMLVLLASLF